MALPALKFLGTVCLQENYESIYEANRQAIENCYSTNLKIAVDSNLGELDGWIHVIEQLKNIVDRFGYSKQYQHELISNVLISLNSLKRGRTYNKVNNIKSIGNPIVIVI